MKSSTFVLGAVVLAGLFASPSADAGYYDHLGVNVVTGSDEAYGTVGTARYSSDGNEYIGCTVNYVPSFPNYTYAYCFAMNSSGTYGSCYFYGDTTAMNLAASINETSYVLFTWNSNGGNCASLEVINGSPYIY